MSGYIDKLIASLVLSSILLLGHSAKADSVEVCGVPLRVDQVAAVEGDLVRARVGEQEKILKQENLGEFLIDTYFADNHTAQSIANLEIQNLLQGCVKENKAYAFLKIIRIWNQRAIDRLSAKQLFRAVIAEVSGPSLLSQALKDGSLADHQQSILSDLLIADFNVAASLGKTEIVANLVRTSGQIFGTNHKLTQDLSKLEKSQLSFEQAIEAGDPAILGDLIVSFEANALLAESNHERIHRAATALITKNNFAGALEILSYIDSAKRSPETHRVAGEALSKMNPGLTSPLEQPRTIELLVEIAKHDAQVKQQFLLAADRQVLFDLENSRTELAESLLLKILELRPDPSAQNDVLRFKTALVYQHRGMRQAALDQLSKMRTGIGIFQRSRALLAGIYLPLYWLVLALALPLIVVGVVIWKHRDHEPEATIVETMQEADQPSGFSYAGKRRARNNPLVQEYAQGLKRLGLGENASFKEIKNSYRRLVKSLHPDSAQSRSEQTTDEFINLNKLYERLLEIRLSLGLPNED